MWVRFDSSFVDNAIQGRRDQNEWWDPNWKQSNEGTTVIISTVWMKFEV